MAATMPGHPNSRIVGGLASLGLLLGLGFSMEFVYVPASVRDRRVAGAEIHTLLSLAAYLTPALIAGALLMARVPPEGLSPTSTRGYAWEVFLALPLLTFAGMSCLCVIVYMAYEMGVDLYRGRLNAALDHATALGGALTYSFAAMRLVGILETKAAKKRRKTEKARRAAGAEEREQKRRQMAALGATVLESESDGEDEKADPANARHEL